MPQYLLRLRPESPVDSVPLKIPSKLAQNGNVAVTRTVRFYRDTTMKDAPQGPFPYELEGFQVEAITDILRSTHRMVGIPKKRYKKNYRLLLDNVDKHVEELEALLASNKHEAKPKMKARLENMKTRLQERRTKLEAEAEKAKRVPLKDLAYIEPVAVAVPTPAPAPTPEPKPVLDPNAVMPPPVVGD